jgi:uncharacterized phage protein (TIGR02218 family)
MAFPTIEGSNYDGSPVVLYEFTRGVDAVFGYAGADKDITTSNGTREIVYVAAPISNSGQTQKGTAVTDVFEITCPATLEVVQWYRYTPPSDTIYLAVRRFHYGDTQSVIVWLGQVVSVEENSEGIATIRCQQVSITLKRGGLRMTWQRGCIHALYDQNCTVDKSLYAVGVSVNIVGVNYLVLLETPSSSTFWNGGILEFDVPSLTGVKERRLIESISGNTLFPYGQMDGYYHGMPLTLYPGCKRTGEWCNSFFHNIDNYGGFEFLPNKSPFSGESVF